MSEYHHSLISESSFSSTTSLSINPYLIFNCPAKIKIKEDAKQNTTIKKLLIEPFIVNIAYYIVFYMLCLKLIILLLKKRN